MKKRMELTDEQQELVKLVERRNNWTFTGKFLEDGIPTWKFKANDKEGYFVKTLVDIYGKKKKKEKYNNGS